MYALFFSLFFFGETLLFLIQFVFDERGILAEKSLGYKDGFGGRQIFLRGGSSPPSRIWQVVSP